MQELEASTSPTLRRGWSQSGEGGVSPTQARVVSGSSPPFHAETPTNSPAGGHTHFEAAAPNLGTKMNLRTEQRSKRDRGEARGMEEQNRLVNRAQLCLAPRELTGHRAPCREHSLK